MRNRKQCIQDTEGQNHEGMEGEEEEESCSCSTLLCDSGTCPICLNVLEQEIGVPESCSHTFCMTCILKWAETRASCPIDRRPFQAVCRLNALDQIKVQVKQQQRKKEEENCACNKEKYSHTKMRRFLRRALCPNRGRFTAKLSKVVKKKYSSILYDKRNRKALSVKINKPRRKTCWNECFRTNFYSTLPAGGSNEEPFLSCRNDSTEFTEVNAVIRQKRQELELSCSSVLARVERIPLMSCGAEAETFLITSTTVAGTILPANSRPLENFGKGYAVACTLEGEEKKQASGSSGARGARRKTVNTTPRRRSARNTKNETLGQSRSSPRSSSSGCSAPDGNNPPLNKSSLESEKALPKRKSKRIVKQQTPLAKKKLRSSAHSEKSSNDSVDDDDTAESEAIQAVDKDQQSDNESSSASLPQKNDAETESANGLERCNEHTETEETAGEHDKDEDTSGDAGTGFSVQESLVLTSGGESQELEVKGLTEKNIDLKNPDICENTIEQMETRASPRDEVCDHATSEKSDQILCSPQGESLENMDALTKVQQPIASPENELLEYPEPLEEDQPLESPRSKLQEHTEVVEVDDSEEKTEVCESTNTQSYKTVQDKEPDTLINNTSTDNTSEQSLKENTVPEGEESRTSESPQVNAEHKHFGEDNNEMIPMDCDSFCSDQNEPQIEQLPPAETTEQGEMDSVGCDAANCTSVSGPSDEKDETIPQEKECQSELKKDKKTRTRRSRFHSPSTTWSPSRREGRKSQSPSPKREITVDRSSRSPKKETVREGRRTLSPKRETEKDEKKAPSRSPKRETVRESRRSSSRSRTRDSSPRQKSRSRSSDRESQRRERDRERRNRRWSRSRSRSRSRSQSRTRNKGFSFSRNERDGHSPRWKERWANDSWRSPRGNERYRRSDQEKQNENLKEKDNTEKNSDDQCSSDKRRNDCPDWVMERINSVPEGRNRERDKPHWEDSRHDNSGHGWNKNFGSGWIPNRGRGHRGRGGRGRGGFMYGDQSENHWQNRKPLSGNSNGSGNETTRFSEHQPYKHKNEQDYSFDTPADRSGWTSASSWAVRKTLPADVQNYYSRRGRNSPSPQSGWGMRQEEETPEQDPNVKDQGNQQSDGSQLPVNMMQQQMNVMPQVNAQHQPMNMFPYPVGVPPPMMNMQRSPFNIHPPMPMHLHAGVPLVQVAAPTNLSQGLPPPPPPPPPSQQVNYIASQQDGKQLQGMQNAAHMSNNMSAPALPAPTAVLGNMGTAQGPSSGNAASSSHVKSSNPAVKPGENKASVTVEASADSSKKDQKLLIQEKAAQEVKLAIKPFYQNKDITKEEYKEIVRKAVDKVCHSKSGEVNSAKVANLVKAYVDKYKHSRKKNPEEAVSCDRK